mmetsp:Transcript_23123/g.49935  ORF Transcript_23123/g.49935 Transcript_23123/m.49935 type:complete len:213 (+) Transcript_23123:318-956(+)
MLSNNNNNNSSRGNSSSVKHGQRLHLLHRSNLPLPPLPRAGEDRLRQRIHRPRERDSNLPAAETTARDFPHGTSRRRTIRIASIIRAAAGTVETQRIRKAIASSAAGRWGRITSRDLDPRHHHHRHPNDVRILRALLVLARGGINLDSNVQRTWTPLDPKRRLFATPSRIIPSTTITATTTKNTLFETTTTTTTNQTASPTIAAWARRGVRP